MDLYRYFHPHHNPRLKSVPLRMQELGELEQAATELKRALERAKIRLSTNEVAGIKEEHLLEILFAAEYISDSLNILLKAHPGDSSSDMKSLLLERQDSPGWENWARLLKQRLELLKEHEPLELKKAS